MDKFPNPAFVLYTIISLTRTYFFSMRSDDDEYEYEDEDDEDKMSVISEPGVSDMPQYFVKGRTAVSEGASPASTPPNSTPPSATDTVVSNPGL